MLAFLGSWIYFTARDRHRRRYPYASNAASREYGFQAIWRWMKRLLFLGLALCILGVGAMFINNAKAADRDKRVYACMTARQIPVEYDHSKLYVPGADIVACNNIK